MGLTQIDLSDIVTSGQFIPDFELIKNIKLSNDWKNKGEFYFSFPGLLNIFKNLQYFEINGNDAERRKAKKIVTSIRYRLRTSLLRANSVFDYSADLTTHVTHDYNSQTVNSKEIIIPVEDPVIRLTDLVNTSEGLEMFQQLGNNGDNKITLLEVLSYITQQSANNIGIWTPTKKSRIEHSRRILSFHIRVNCSLLYFGDYINPNPEYGIVLQKHFA